MSLITLKKRGGGILFSFPFAGGKRELRVLQEKIENLPWNIISIHLYGPLLEVLVHFNDLLQKVPEKVKIEIMELLWQRYLPGSKVKSKSEVNQGGDFAITHHLVPEQMVIFPLFAFNLKKRLIFRYPGHEKKLLQYIKYNRHHRNKILFSLYRTSFKKFYRPLSNAN